MIGARNKIETIIVNFLNFKDKSKILNTFRQEMLFKEKIFENKDFRGDSQNY